MYTISPFEILKQAILMPSDKNQVSGSLLAGSWGEGGVRDPLNPLKMEMLYVFLGFNERSLCNYQNPLT